MRKKEWFGVPTIVAFIFIEYSSGAYSPWPTDDGCDPKGCWKSAIFVYVNSNIDTIFNDAQGNPQNPHLKIGWNDWSPSISETEAKSKSLESRSLNLQAGDCLTFIAVDERESYHWPADNRGTVTLQIRTTITDPFREHSVVSAGTGPLTHATYSDGLASFSEQEVTTVHFRVHNINGGTTTDGCGVATKYDSQKIWFGSASPATIEINGTPIAQISSSTDQHGFMFEWQINVGDRICIEPVPDWFHIIFGPDIYYHYDSFCSRYPERCQ